MKLTSALILVALMTVSAAQAATYSFEYDGTSGSPSSITGNFTLSNGSDVIQSLSGFVDGQAIKSLNSGSYDITSLNQGLFSANFNVALTSYAINGFLDFGVGSATVFDGFGIPSGSGNLTISAVPLPPSAPMFGAALFAVGAIGYGMKSRKAAAAT